MRRWTCCLTVLVCGVWTLSGCRSETEFQEFSETDSQATEEHDHDHDHDHAHEAGPHGGHLVEFGEEEFHGEVVLGASSRVLTVYILGADGKTSHPIEQPSVALTLSGESPVELTLPALPDEGETDGKSSRFQLPAEQLPESIKDEEDLTGEISATIDGKAYAGKITHDHDHAH